MKDNGCARVVTESRLTEAIISGHCLNSLSCAPCDWLNRGGKCDQSARARLEWQQSSLKPNLQARSRYLVKRERLGLVSVMFRGRASVGREAGQACLLDNGVMSERGDDECCNDWKRVQMKKGDGEIEMGSTVR